MKKRNQLVSVMLTGMLFGSAAVATVGTTPMVVLADEEVSGSEALEEAEESEESYDAQDSSDDGGSVEVIVSKPVVQEKNCLYSGGSDDSDEEAVSVLSEESGDEPETAFDQAAESESSGHQENSSEASGGSASEGETSGSESGEKKQPDAQASESSSTDSGSASDAAGSTDNSSSSGTEESGTDSGSSSGTEESSTDSGSSSGTEESSTESGSESGTESGTESGSSSNTESGSSSNTESGSESDTESSTESGTDSGSESGSGNSDDASGGTDSSAETPSQPEKDDPSESDTDPGSDDSGETPDEDDSGESNGDQEEADDPSDPAADDQDDKEPEAEEQPDTPQDNSSSEWSRSSYYGSGYTYSGNGQYSYGTYFVSETQRRLSLNLGFKQVAKKYALPKGDFVYIRESRSDDATVIGVLEAGYLCYILEEGNNGWVFVESGDVRGFVRVSDISWGSEVDALVAKTGEENLKLAIQKVDPLDNSAYRYTLTTTRDVSKLLANIINTTVSRQDVIDFAQQFVGNPYVWGGTSLTTGTDSAGFTQQVYAHFGVSIPSTSEEQSKAGVKITAEESQPGDLLFYARDGVIYHVLMDLGNGKAISAASTTTGIAISDIDYSQVCWGCRFLTDAASSESSTQASALTATGRAAYNGDEAARGAIIAAFAAASEKEWQEYGFCRSVLIAQAIEESGWCAFRNTGAGIQAVDNNILGMNTDLLNSKWTSPWSGASISRLVPQYVNGSITYDFEDMRAYSDIESCMEDYAAFKIGLHPELAGVTDVDTVIEIGLKGYATNPEYQATIKRIIDKYDLTQYDTPYVDHSGDEDTTGEDASAADDQDQQTVVPGDETPENPDTSAVPNDDSQEEPDAADEQAVTPAVTGMYRIDSTEYSQEELELIWAIVAQEDDISYDGALAVISAVMNRADVNYGGFGLSALEQLTADGQYCYSASVADPIYYQRRLGGNVPDFVKQAIDDCLANGVRSHGFNSFSSVNEGGYTQIGSNWYYNSEAPVQETNHSDDWTGDPSPTLPKTSDTTPEPWDSESTSDFDDDFDDSAYGFDAADGSESFEELPDSDDQEFEEETNDDEPEAESEEDASEPEPDFWYDDDWDDGWDDDWESGWEASDWGDDDIDDEF